MKSTGGLVVGWQSDRSYRPEPGFGEGQLPLLAASVLSDLLRTESTPVAVEAVKPRPDRQLTGPSGSRTASYAVEGRYTHRTPERRPIPTPATFRQGETEEYAVTLRG